jgi:hypothetical protein
MIATNCAGGSRPTCTRSGAESVLKMYGGAEILSSKKSTDYDKNPPTSHPTIKAMILTPEQFAELLEASKPLMKWISDNCHPHCFALVDYCRVTLSEEAGSNLTTEFIKD